MDHDLEADLLASAEMRQKVRDVAYARRLYAALCNVDWLKGDEGPWSCTWRYAGGLVARLRAIGEDYLHFYCSGAEGTVAPDVAVDLTALGWTPASENKPG